MNKVIVYTKSPCPDCVSTKNRMTKLGIDFEERSIQDNWSEVAQFNYKAAPIVTVWDGPRLVRSWCGFRYDAIKSLAVRDGNARYVDFEPSPGDPKDADMWAGWPKTPGNEAVVCQFCRAEIRAVPSGGWEHLATEAKLCGPQWPMGFAEPAAAAIEPGENREKGCDRTSAAGEPQ